MDFSPHPPGPIVEAIGSTIILLFLAGILGLASGPIAVAVAYSRRAIGLPHEILGLVRGFLAVHTGNLVLLSLASLPFLRFAETSEVAFFASLLASHALALCAWRYVLRHIRPDEFPHVFTP